ncbi:putative PepSY-like beta-lactamase-inhibitor [Arcicella aurantiaca]|uniref:Putative PepSY-like beta-lactamase-inhibitor n=1 Tax=Arcicella aurantiaca TaxID=591202 RepID=A0A316E1J2_9BACT|nr:PepSY-like domain-containing protein [Arcicella aurantiaca]PWK23339.1 putative PepSY-like beta-lactamase-inhibitor [Arcicella aurantiaca]
MKKLLFICSMTFVGLLTGCTEKLETVIDSSQTVDNATTARISAVIKTDYPSATNLSVSTIDDKKVYGCDFSVSGISHEAAVSATGQILSVYHSTDDVTLPDAIKTYLSTTYAGYKLEKVGIGKDASGNTSYKILIQYNDQKITIVFDAKYAVVATFSEPKNNVTGDKNKVFATKLADLPATIQTQLSGYDFIGAVVKTNSEGKKTYFVTAKKDGILYEFTYDNEGKLIKTVSIDPSKKIEDKSLKENELPQVVKDYLQINYKDWKYEKGVVLMQGGVIDSYSIVISKDKKIALLLFDKDGKFLKVVETPTIQLPKFENKDLIVADLPSVITEYLNKTYAGWTFTKGSVTLKDSSPEAYYVYITVGADKYHVYFDKNGKFLAAKRG